jgi:hypothetical protein
VAGDGGAGAAGEARGVRPRSAGVLSRGRGSATEGARGGGGVGERRKKREGRERDGRGAHHGDPILAINVSKT